MSISETNFVNELIFIINVKIINNLSHYPSAVARDLPGILLLLDSFIALAKTRLIIIARKLITWIRRLLNILYDTPEVHFMYPSVGE